MATHVSPSHRGAWQRSIPLGAVALLAVVLNSCNAPVRGLDGGSPDEGATTTSGLLGEAALLRATNTERPFPRHYCDTPASSPLANAPKPFLYKPFEGHFTGEVWTAQMDHTSPTYSQDGTLSALGEVLNNSASGPGLAGGTVVYPGRTWHEPSVAVETLIAGGSRIFSYQSPSSETYVYYDGHDGHDFAFGDLQPVPALAAADGVVVFKGDYGNSLGQVVEVLHRQGYLTRYAHLASFEDGLDLGSEVRAGEEIGVIGGSAVVNGRLDTGYWHIHLHFSVFRWSDSDRRWLITDPFGWDPWAGETAAESVRAQAVDPLRRCNGEVSYNLWVDRWPRDVSAEREQPFPPTHDDYVGGWYEEAQRTEPTSEVEIEPQELQTNAQYEGYPIDWSPDGAYLATSRFGQFVWLWNTDPPGDYVRVRIGLPAVDLAFSPDTHYIAAARFGADGGVALYSLEERSQLTSLGDGVSMSDVAFSPDGSYIAAAGRDNQIWLWRVPSGDLEAVLAGHTAFVQGIAFSPLGDLLASVSWDGTVRLWRIPDGAQVRWENTPSNEPRRPNHPWGVAFSHDGAYLAVTAEVRTAEDGAGQLLVWRVADWQLIQAVDIGPNYCCVEFSSRGHILATSAPEGVRLWAISESDGLNEIASLKRTPIVDLAFSPDGVYLAAAGWDDGVTIWNLNH